MRNDSEAIRWVRTLRGYSRKALAEAAGLRAERLTHIEYGARPRPDELAAIWGVLAAVDPWGKHPPADGRDNQRARFPAAR
jgi:transcriptional regulator with XRE-family HTH domain